MSSRHKKRSRSGKNIASSSAAPPVFPYQDDSYMNFNSEAEYTRLITKFENRVILPPRFSSIEYLESSAPAAAANMLRASNLLDFLLLKCSHIHPPLIRAFYSNLKEDNDADLVTTINGVQIMLSEENIQAISQLPLNGEDISMYIREGGILFDERSLLDQIGLESFDLNQTTRRPTIKGMLPEFRLIFYFITRVLKPRKHSHTTISQEDAKLLHAIITGARINWCKFVKIHMLDARRDDKPLPYAFLVMKILEATGLDITNGPIKRGTKHWEISASSFTTVGEHAPPPSPHPQPRRTQNPTLQTIFDQLASLSVNCIDQNVTRLTYELHGYFDHIHYPNGGLVPYETVPDNVEDEENDE